MTPLVIEIILLLGKLLFGLAAVLLLPTFVMKFFYRQVGFGLLFTSTILWLFLPVISLLNNYLLNESLLPFIPWGVGGIDTLSWMSWGLTLGAVCAYAYAAEQIISCRLKSTRTLVCVFSFLGYGLNFLAQVALPIFLFGDYGKTMAEDDLPFLLVSLVFTIAVAVYVRFSETSELTYTQ